MIVEPEKVAEADAAVQAETELDMFGSPASQHEAEVVTCDMCDV